MTVEEPRVDSWHLRPASTSTTTAAAASAAADKNNAATTTPLVVSFPSGFRPPVSSWEAYEGREGKQLVVVARAVRFESRGAEDRRKKKNRIGVARFFFALY